MASQRKYRVTPPVPIDPLAGLVAAKALMQKFSGTRTAIGGGMAMFCHGFVRATQDVDIIAADIPEGLVKELKQRRELTFGGMGGTTVEGKVPVDWIHREDERAEIYEAALQAVVYRTPHPSVGRIAVISPEWLLIMKHFAGRSKDEIDLLWLLRQPKLVDRPKLLAHAKQLFGKHAYALTDPLQNYFLEADMLKARDEARE